MLFTSLSYLSGYSPTSATPLADDSPILDMDNLNIATIVVPVAAAALCYHYVQSNKRKLPYPPSPKADPLIGHLRKLPMGNEHIAYRDWGRELNSDIIMLRIPGQAFIVLNSAQAASELFEKRSRKYSGRPYLPMVMDPIDWSRHIGFLPYGERWKRQRQLMNTSFRKTAVHKFGPSQTKQARQAAVRMLDNPKGFVVELTRMSAAQTLECAYGYEMKTADDHMLKTIETTASHLEKAIMPTDFLVNILPWLNRFPSWFPGTGWKKVAQEWREELQHTVEEPYNFTMSQVAKGVAPPSALSEMLANAQTLPEDVTPEEKDYMMWTVASFYTAAVHSTAASIHVFVLAMTIHREVQIKIQEEIERVTGGKRLPELSDMESMPYVRCVILEVLRWQPVTPLGIPHSCDEEDEYNGYIIPKDSIIFGNIWAINRDETVYSDPESFNPERFLDPAIPEPVTFGFGRRSCPGMHFAKSSLFINITTMLATFDIRPILDQNGQEILPEVKMVQGVMVTNPAPFDCSITPRSEIHKQMLMEGALE
ncbi:cytochrome P450 [Ceratobasidium sp. AG-I]|nr:cytochrome P450 [Ceratobasidium sp. AG-I]